MCIQTMPKRQRKPNFGRKRPEAAELQAGDPKKVYVASGDLRRIVVAQDALEAVVKALELGIDGRTLDPDYFFVDERGYRTQDATWKVPIFDGLTAAGMELE